MQTAYNVERREIPTIKKRLHFILNSEVEGVIVKYNVEGTNRQYILKTSNHCELKNWKIENPVMGMYVPRGVKKV